MRQGKRKLKKYFFDALDYLRESSRFIFIIIGIFAVSLLIGFFFPDKFTFLDATLKELARKVEGLGFLELFAFIFINNIKAAFIGLALGGLLGLFPVFTALFNGAVVGYVFHKVKEANGYGEFWRILPHGIFELPAIFISLGLGLRLGMFVFAEDKGKEFKRRAINSLIVFLTIVIPLLIIAALIEALLIGAYK